MSTQCIGSEQVTDAEQRVLVEQLERRIQVLPHAAGHAADFKRLPLAACGCPSEPIAAAKTHRVTLVSCH